MRRFKIIKIEAIGKKGVSSIEFADKVTLIMGKSETGKSSIWRCVDYLLGADKDSKHLPFIESTGYDTVKGYFTNGSNHLTLTRKINDSKIKVETDLKDVDTNVEYNITTTSPKWIGCVLNSFLGIEQNFKIPHSFDGKMRRFSWRDVKQEFMTNEHRAETESSILLSQHETNNTALLAELLYLLFEFDFDDYDAEEGTRMKRAKKIAVQKYITSKKESILEKISKIENLNLNLSDEEINDLTSKLVDKIDEMNTLIDETQAKYNSINDNLTKYNEQRNELKIALKSYRALESQYTADIKRLDFVVKGEKIEHEREHINRCPFCDSDIDSKHNGNQVEYLESAKAELRKTVNHLNGLNQTTNDTQVELTQIESEIEKLNQIKDELSISIKEKLIPEQKSLTKQLENYKLLVEYKKALQLYAEFTETYSSDFKEYDKVDAQINFKPKTLFGEHFVSELQKNYAEILSAINFSPINEVVFNINDFDMVVNGNPKPNRSKGYSAILNTTLVLSLRKFMNDYGKINPHFYFLDSPLHGLMTETSDENNEDDLRKGFFKYIFENSENDQIIIIENTDYHEIPKNIPSDCKVYEFTKDKERGRYGFLNDVYQN